MHAEHVHLPACGKHSWLCILAPHLHGPVFELKLGLHVCILPLQLLDLFLRTPRLLVIVLPQQFLTVFLLLIHLLVLAFLSLFLLQLLSHKIELLLQLGGHTDLPH